MEIREKEGAPSSFLQVVGPLPPPLHGAAAATQDIIDRVSPLMTVYPANVARSAAGSITGHATKAMRVLRAMAMLARPKRGRRAVLYMAADGGRGLLYNIAVAAIARICGYEIFLHHHSFAYIDRYSALMSLLTGIMGKSSSHIMLCGVMADQFRRRYPVVSSRQILKMSGSAFLNIVDGHAGRNPDASLRIGFLSNLIIEKGLDTSIDLLRAARAEGLDVHLVLAGRSTGEKSSRLVNDAVTEFGPAIQYLGQLTDGEKVRFFEDIDLFAFPTRYINEAQPRAVLEAMAAGVPVLTVARSCITGDVGPEGGMCVPRSDDFVTAVLPHVRLLCADRRLMVEKSRRALNRARELQSDGLKDLDALIAALAAAPPSIMSQGSIPACAN